jgi:hypothetical protein
VESVSILGIMGCTLLSALRERPLSPSPRSWIMGDPDRLRENVRPGYPLRHWAAPASLSSSRLSLALFHSQRRRLTAVRLLSYRSEEDLEARRQARRAAGPKVGAFVCLCLCLLLWLCSFCVRVRVCVCVCARSCSIASRALKHIHARFRARTSVTKY